LAIDLPEIDLSTPRDSDRLTVLYLSRLDPKKNLESLLQAWPAVVACVPGALLKIAGTGDPAYVDLLKAQARALGIESTVAWVGHVSGDAKSACFREADLFVLPSFAENFGIAVAEALSYGLPCVVAKGVALSDEIATHDAGIRTEPAVESISDALTRALSEQPWRTRAAVAARRLAETNFSVDALGRGLVDLYKKISLPKA
jgi:glycosyltransferase involved in cell wall biosynthesis